MEGYVKGWMMGVGEKSRRGKNDRRKGRKRAWKAVKQP